MPRHVKWSAGGLLAGIVVTLAVVGAVSLFDGDEDVRVPLPDADRAGKTAKLWAQLRERPGEKLRSSGCEYLAGSLVPPFRYDCEVSYDSGRRFRLRVAEAVGGELVSSVDRITRVRVAAR